ncbi:MAG: hypothetical protein JST54_15125 [Deltaproteobacteria bacterium]|nr:hypothetical protein [Deltaproteobacteria bacterium]
MLVRRAIGLGVLALALGACGSKSATGADAGVVDAGPVDAGLRDAGPNDAGALDAGPEDAGAPDSGIIDAGPVDAGRLARGEYLLTLDAGAFPPTPAHPSALVYIPDGFNLAPPLDVIVYIHGFNNCVVNIVRDAGESCDPDAGLPVSNAYALEAQLDASGKNAILLAPEIAFDQATGAPGTLADDGGFRALLAEALVDMQPVLGTFTVDDVGTVVLASHSGGYQAAAGIATRGGVPVQELWLFDSLYGDFSDFDAWVNQDLASLSTLQRRFADVYTCCGGTLANSQDMADRAASWVGADSGVLVDDRTTDTWPPATYLHGLLFKSSALAHDGVPRYYFQQLLQTSSLRDR